MKKQINFYQPSCYPKRRKATFKQFVGVVSLCLCAAIILTAVLKIQLANTKANTLAHKQLLVTKQAELNHVIAVLKDNSERALKVNEKLALNAEISAKQKLLSTLSKLDSGEGMNFPILMKGLSLANMNTINIHAFSIIDGHLDISGTAKYSDSVALWLNQFQEIKELSNVSFNKLILSARRNHHDFSFKLTEHPKAQTNKGEVK